MARAHGSLRKFEMLPAPGRCLRAVPLRKFLHELGGEPAFRDDEVAVVVVEDVFHTSCPGQTINRFCVRLIASNSSIVIVIGL
jgi:hypothetical protein